MNLGAKISFPTDDAKPMMHKLSVKSVCSDGAESSSLFLQKRKTKALLMVTGVVLATVPPMPKLVYGSFLREIRKF